MRYFDYETVASEAKIPTDKLAVLAKSVRQDFPIDDMLYELHLMRVCSAIQAGFVSLEKTLHLGKAA
ncbi:MAG: hypothetical protein A2992_07440 [Elusimicrobia bacterium RIFCSPLOWO2_01_FULL_59_12]|nr:MAG: hypothetical protein A2992_07440 [Elusimicrobia bacterium RIFCSPLOWO2_01_FULL_59_12]